MKGNFKATEALVLLDSATVAPAHAKRFQAAVAEQFCEIGRTEKLNARRAVLVGLALPLVKKSLPKGQFEAWKKTNLTNGKVWTPGTALKNASLYTRLAIAFLQEAKPAAPELLAITAGTAVTGTVERSDKHGAKMLERLDAFCGDKSINELLDEHGIRDAAASTGSRGAGAAIAADTDTLLEDVGQLFLNFDQVLLDPEQLKRFPIRQLDEIERNLAERLEKLRALKAKLTNRQE